MISINIDKAKTIAHEARRAARSAEFAPLDVQATIPAKAAEAEAARQVVRDKYAAMQTAIRTTIGFLRLASHRCVATLCTDHCSKTYLLSALSLDSIVGLVVGGF